MSRKAVPWFKFPRGFLGSYKMNALRHHHKNVGAIILIYIWDYLLGCDNQRTPYNEDVLDVWAISFNEDIELIRKVVECCIYYKLLQKDSQDYIYSEDLNDLLADYLRKLENDRVYQHNRYHNKKATSRSDNESSRSDNKDSRRDNDGSRSEKGDSRYKKIKDNIRGDENTTSTSYVNTGDDGCAPEDAADMTAIERLKQSMEQVDTVEGINLILSDRKQMLSIQSITGFSEDDINQWAPDFLRQCEKDQKPMHTNIDDLIKHFNSWLQKKREYNESPPEKPSIDSTDKARALWNSCIADLQGRYLEESCLRDLTCNCFRGDETNKGLLWLVIKASSTNVKETFDKKYLSVMEEILQKYTSDQIKVICEVADTARRMNH